jgi:hypothetical protein
MTTSLLRVSSYRISVVMTCGWRKNGRQIERADQRFNLVYYEKVLNWLQNNGPNDNGDNSLKPYLFCGDSWAIRKTLQDPLFGSDGKSVKDNDGNVVLIGQNNDMLDAQSATTKNFGQATLPVTNTSQLI